MQEFSSCPHCGLPHDYNTTPCESFTDYLINKYTSQSSHKKRVGVNGMTDGLCVECDEWWPCREYHKDMNFDPEEDDTDWCYHEGVNL